MNKFLGRNITNESQWEAYKKLELIPDSVANPQANTLSFTFGLNQAWRLLLTALMDELVDELQVDYLERCWALNDFESDDNASFQSLQRFWMLMS
jgi:hypothetical protein